MKIGIDISQIVFEGTGVATYTRNLVTNLLRLNKNGRHDYILFGASLRRKQVLDDFANKLSSEGLKFSTSFWLLPPTLTAEVWNQIHHVKIEKLIGRIDLFHSSDWTEPPSKARKVTTIHDLVIYRYPEYAQTKIGFNLQRLAPIADIVSNQKQKLAWVKKECDLVIADSQATKRDITQLLDIPERKIRVIYLAAGEDFKAFSRLPEKDRQTRIKAVRLKYHLSRSYLLGVGTQEPRKNIARLLEAFRAVGSKDIDMVIAGQYSWGNENFKSQNSNFKLLGFVPQEDLPALYAGAKGLIYPSLYEGFGVPLLEAMTVGCPVVTSNLGSMPEVGGSAAIYIHPEEVDSIAGGIRKLLNLSNKEDFQLRAKSKTQAQKFSWEETARETLKLYEELGQ